MFFPHLRATVARLQNRLGLKITAVNRQSKHLDYNHPSMKAVRDHIEAAIHLKQVEPRLLGNFDQVWSVHYEAPKKTVYKHFNDKGKLIDPLMKKKSLQRIIQHLQNPLDEAAGGKHGAVCPRVQLNGAGNLNPVDYARVARTCTTLSWSDGDMGRSWITLGPGSMCKP